MNQKFKPDDAPCLVLSVWQIEELEDLAYQRGVEDTLSKVSKSQVGEKDESYG